jgi:hypothetical protein
MFCEGNGGGNWVAAQYVEVIDTTKNLPVTVLHVAAPLVRVISDAETMPGIVQVVTAPIAKVCVDIVVVQVDAPDVKPIAAQRAVSAAADCMPPFIQNSKPVSMIPKVNKNNMGATRANSNAVTPLRQRKN